MRSIPILHVAILLCYYTSTELVWSMEQESKKIVYSCDAVKFAPQVNLNTLHTFLRWQKKASDSDTLPNRFTTLPQASLYKSNLSNTISLQRLHDAQREGYRPAFYKEGELLLTQTRTKKTIEKAIGKLIEAARERQGYVYEPACRLLADNLYQQHVTPQQKKAIISMLQKMYSYGQTELIQKVVLAAAQHKDWKTINQLISSNETVPTTCDKRTTAQFPFCHEDAYALAVTLLSEEVSLDDIKIIPKLIKYAQTKVPEAFLFQAAAQYNGRYGFKKDVYAALDNLISFWNDPSEKTIENYTTTIQIIATMAHKHNEHEADKKMFDVLIKLHSSGAERIRTHAELWSNYLDIVMYIGLRLCALSKGSYLFSSKEIKAYGAFLTKLYLPIMRGETTREQKNSCKKLVCLLWGTWYGRVSKQASLKREIKGRKQMLALHNQEKLFETDREVGTVELELAYYYAQNKEFDEAYKLFEKQFDRLLKSTEDIDALCAYTYASLLYKKGTSDAQQKATDLFTGLTTWHNNKTAHAALYQCAVIHLNKKEYTQTFTCIDRLLEKDPKNKTGIRELHKQTLGLRIEHYQKIKPAQQKLSSYLIDVIEPSRTMLGENEFLVMLLSAYTQEKNQSKITETKKKMHGLSSM